MICEASVVVRQARWQTEPLCLPRPARIKPTLQLVNMDYASTLPREVLVKIFSGLMYLNPDSVRDLCAAASVCPSWREAAKEPSLWRNLDVSKAPLNTRLTGPRLRNLIARSCNTLSWLWLDGCLLLREAMLGLAVQQQPLLVYVRVTNCILVTRPGLAYALCDAENFQGVVEQLNDPRLTAADAQRCCVALYTLLNAKNDAERVATLAEAQAAGTLDALLRCAALYASHAGVQAASCWALLQYVYVAQRTEVASYPPIFQAAVTAMKAYPLDADVHGPALVALSSACWFGLEGTPGVPALLDAIQPVLAALRAFPTDLDVREYGSKSLVKMCGMDASVAGAVAAAGAMGLFMKTLNLVITDDSTHVAAVEAIGAIALSPAALPQASAGIDAVICTLRRHEKSSTVALSACKTLCIYLRCAVTRDRAVRGCADFAVRLVAQIHSTDTKVKKAAEDALKAPQA